MSFFDNTRKPVGLGGKINDVRDEHRPSGADGLGDDIPGTA